MGASRLPKIAVLTLNPGIDRVIRLIEPTHAGGHNRAEQSMTYQGSKGANQAIMLSNLGAEVEYFSFTGGEFGSLSESFTDRPGINAHFTETVCGVRLNTKVIDSNGLCTEFNESGGPITKEEYDTLMSQFFSEISDDCDIMSLCGSFPQGVEKAVYNSIAEEAKRNGKTVILDCAGDALKLGLSASPDLIKPNRLELSQIIGILPQTPDEAFAACGKIFHRYDTEVLCTLDSDGSVFVGRDGGYRIGVAPFALRGFSGAGDAYLAAYIYSKYLRGDTTPDALRLGAAASCAKIALEGTEMPTAGQTADAERFISVVRLY